MDEQYCSVLIVNETSTCLELLIYSRLDPICWLSLRKKIVLPGKEYLYRSENPFQFQLRANGKKQEQETIVPVRMFEKDTLLRVTGSPGDRKIAQEDLTEYPGKKLPILLRRLNMEEESSANGGRNLYEILKIDMEELRRKPIQVQNEMIKKAFRREMLRWHPDRKTGDIFMCQEVIVAYEILRDPESRARYNNAVDYDNGWLSASRWKAIFWPECNTDKQKRDYWWRMVVLLLSSLSAVAGLVFVVNPEISAIGGAVVGGALNIGLPALSRDAVLNGNDPQCFIERIKVGAAKGSVVAGQLAGLIAAAVGGGNAAIKCQVEILARKLLPMLPPIAFEGLKRIRQRPDSEGDMHDCEIAGASHIPEEGLTLEYLQSKYGLDEAEASGSSQAPDGGHGAMHTGQCRIGRVCYTTNGAWISRMIVRYNIGSDERKEEIVEGSGKSIVLPEEAKNIEVRFQVLRFIGTWCDVKKYDRVENRWCKPAEAEVFKYDAPPSCSFTLDGSLYYEAVMDVADRPCQELDEIWDSDDGRIRYICKGLFGSRMTVEYTDEKNERRKEVVEGSGRSVILPKEAKNIEVKFHVLRFIATWCRVKKYDRFRQCWVEPTEQHIFNYDVPPIRTFTIDGSLYYEYVSKVTDGTFQELNEL